MRSKKVDLVFLGILAVFSLINLFMHFFSGEVLSINHYAGFLLLAVVMLLQFYASDRFRWSIAVLLFLGTFSILGFSYGVFNSSFVQITDDLTYNPPGFNPILFLMLVVYCFINFNYLKSVVSSKQEGDENDKMTAFYYNKFAECDSAEFKDIAKRIDMYPIEAQEAIHQLIAEREINKF